MAAPFRFLVVDDLEVWRKSLSRQLQKLDLSASIEVAASFEEADQRIHRAVYDLVTMDLALRGEPEDARHFEELGLELARRLRSSPGNRHCGLLVVTGYPSTERIRRALRDYAAHDFLPKEGFNRERFLTSARGALRECIFGRAQEQRGRLYRFEINFTEDRLVDGRLSGPRSAEYVVSDPAPLETARLGELGDRLNVLLTEGLPGEWRTSADALGKEIFRALDLAGPIGQGLSAARALPEQDSDLCLHFRGPAPGLTVPFELLKDDDHKPLCFRYLLTREVSSQSGFVSRKNSRFDSFLKELIQTGEPLRILLVGSDGDGTIPAALEEINAIQSRLETDLGLLGIDHEILLLQGGAATCGTVTAVLADVHLFHFAGHGRFDSRMPEISGLMLSDGALRASDLYLALQNSKLRVAFLSCCLGARTAEKIGRGSFYGVFEAFARADVPIVLGYRWTVLDNSALRMADCFYSELWRTLSPAEALLLARRALAMGGMGWDDDTWASPVLLTQNP